MFAISCETPEFGFCLRRFLLWMCADNKVNGPVKWKDEIKYGLFFHLIQKPFIKYMSEFFS